MIFKKRKKGLCSEMSGVIEYVENTLKGQESECLSTSRGDFN